MHSLCRFLCQSNPDMVQSFETVLFDPFQVILQQDVAGNIVIFDFIFKVIEFMPYVFQILSQLLEFHNEAGIPPAYQAMLTPLLQPALWESHGMLQLWVKY